MPPPFLSCGSKLEEDGPDHIWTPGMLQLVTGKHTSENTLSIAWKYDVIGSRLSPCETSKKALWKWYSTKTKAPFRCVTWPMCDVLRLKERYNMDHWEKASKSLAALSDRQLLSSGYELFEIMIMLTIITVLVSFALKAISVCSKMVPWRVDKAKAKERTRSSKREVRQELPYPPELSMCI
eukprot:GHVQ01025673.1.p1 GENE.GHVQ01025673.1~~GHVQ01025673.1.p1  ORF type:complete len:181 (-),score=10.40 GHVQ01025673.1:150-692(-)